MSITDISICSTALVMVGANSISSFTEASREAEVAYQVYPIELQSLLTENPWRFSIRYEQLSQLIETPLYGFKYAYQLPPDLLQLRSISTYGPYELFENKLFSDEETCQVEYQFRPLEAKFPAYFVDVLLKRLASVFAASLMEDESKMQLFEGLADKRLRRAKLIDSQQQPSKAIRDGNFVLINARR